MLGWLWAACGTEPAADEACVVPPPATGPSEVLFGLPTAATGLTGAQCAPSCGCGDEAFAPPQYSAADAAALLDWTLLAPYAPLVADPYAAPPTAAPAEDGVCAVVVEAAGYRLVDSPSADAARAAGALPTHTGACGVCSTLADLAVYMRTPDLTAPVRDCGLENLNGAAADHVACLQALGFTEPCADIWYYNTLHTSDACAAVCFAKLDAPYNLPTGELNACLQCDEDESGAVFAAVAGRTRRNTGLPSSICRPCAEVEPIVHDYGSPR